MARSWPAFLMTLGSGDRVAPTRAACIRNSTACPRRPSTNALVRNPALAYCHPRSRTVRWHTHYQVGALGRAGVGWPRCESESFTLTRADTGHTLLWGRPAKPLRLPDQTLGDAHMSPFRTELESSVVRDCAPPLATNPSIRTLALVTKAGAEPPRKHWWSRLRRAQRVGPASRADDVGSRDD